MGSYVTQYYNNVLVAFNNSSKYVQISAGQIAIYNGEVTTKANEQYLTSREIHSIGIIIL